MESELKMRLKTFIKYLGLSQNSFILSVGLSKGYMNKVNSYMSPETLNKFLAVYPRLNTDWLLTGNGNMITSASQEPEKVINKRLDYSGRIKKIRETLFDSSNKKFAEAVGEDDSTIRKWVNSTISDVEIQNLVQKLPQVNENWLLTGEGKIMNDSAVSAESSEIKKLPPKEKVKKEKIPLAKINYAPRVRLIRENLFNGSNQMFAKKMGITPNIISMWCTVRAGRKILEKILAKMPNINKNWLLTGVGAMTLSQEQTQEQKTNIEAKQETVKKTPLEQSFDALVKLSEQNSNSLDKLISIIEREKKEKEDLIKEKSKLQKEKDELFELLSKLSSHVQYKNPPRDQNKNYVIKVKDNNNDKQI